MAVGLGETITVINKSGKVVSSSKHIVNVFKEAKAAYRERKAEIKAERDAVVKEREVAKKALRAAGEDDDARSQVSHRSKASKAHTHRKHDRPTMERGYSDSFYANDSPRSSKHRLENDLGGHDAHNKEIARRNSDQAVQRSSQSKSRSKSVDMDLCYGDVPPPLPEKKYDDLELKEKASKIEMLLDEANCLQHTATAMIENLQKNPEALAAVSLTLAEISAIVGKMGPGVLTALKAQQFMIAGGVAVGVTIVALGGYKIIKKMQAQPAVEEPMPAAPQMPLPVRAATMPLPIEDSNNELDELEPQELSRVEKWRRGIADVEANSSGTSVDGEFITPEASRTLVAAGVLDEDDLKEHKSHRAPKSDFSVKTSKTSDSKRHSSKEKSSKEKVPSSKVAPSVSSKSGKESSKSKKKEKEPSGLKMLFRAHTVAV
ncbi:unnamed protein product [Alternaria alternata]